MCFKITPLELVGPELLGVVQVLFVLAGTFEVSSGGGDKLDKSDEHDAQ